MRTVQRFFWLHLFIAVLALSVGIGITIAWPPALIPVLFGAAWFAGQLRIARLKPGKGAEGIGPANLMLFFFLGGCVVGVLNAAPGWLMLLAAVAALGAWDLDHFLRRMSSVERVEFTSGLGRNHLRRLGMCEVLGLLAGLPALFLRINLSFGWVALLVLVAVITISQIVMYVRRETE